MVCIQATPDGLCVDEVRAWRSRVSGSHAAVYYPWVRAKDANGAERMLPPSSFVAGIYARVDREHGIFRRPQTWTYARQAVLP